MQQLERVEGDTCSTCGREANVYVRFPYEEFSLCDECRHDLIENLKAFGWPKDCDRVNDNSNK